MKYILGILVVLVSFLSCKKDEPKVPETPSSTGFSLDNLLKNWSTSIIIPGYEYYKDETAALSAAVSEFKTNPNADNLAELQLKWKSAYLLWQHVAMFEFGPASDITLRSETNIYPTDTIDLNKLIHEGSTNINGANKLDVKGFPALDYLLNAGSETTVLTSFTNGPNAIDRMNYLVELAKQISDNAASVNANWSTAGGNYATEFIEANGTDAGSSIGLVINALTQHIERHLRDGKLGIPNGNRNFSGSSLPNHIEAVYDGSSSIELALENLKAIEAFYLGISSEGVNGIGMDDYLISLGAEYNEGSLDNAVKDQFAICIEKLNAIPKPLKGSLVSNKTLVDEAVKELQRLIILFKADIPSATGVLITYQDNDGD